MDYAYSNDKIILVAAGHTMWSTISYGEQAEENIQDSLFFKQQENNVTSRLVRTHKNQCTDNNQLYFLLHSKLTA